MSNFNFSGVEVAEENNNSEFKRVEPGFQKLTIVSLEDVVSSVKGSKGVKVTFESDKGGTFTKDFWLADSQNNKLEKAMPSFQYLVSKFTGDTLSGDINTEALAAKLVGKSHDVTVGGRRYTTEKDGKRYDNIAADLPFAGWSGESMPIITGSFAAAETVSESSKGSDDLPF